MMTRILLALTLGLLLALPLIGAPPQRLRLASWNLHNFFDSQDDPGGDSLPSPAQVEKKLSKLSQALRLLQGQVVALQEVENLPLLQRLAQASGYRYAILVEGNDQARGIDVALLSNVAVRGYRSHRLDRLISCPGGPPNPRFSRDCLEVHLSTPTPWILLVNHFKSKMGSSKAATALRRSQAQGVVNIVASLTSRYPQAQFVVLGDLNDELDSWSLEPLKQSGLLDPFASLPRAERITYRYRGRGSALDHILLSPSLSQQVIPGSPGVGQEKIFRSCSDHRPLWLDFRR